MTEPLMPCPLAWETVHNVVIDNTNGTEHAVGCTHCDVWTPNFATEAEAIAAWNQRAPKALAAEETGWLIERDDIATIESNNRVCLHYYAEWPTGKHYWTPDHMKAKRFADEVLARREANNDPLLRVAEHMWIASNPSATPLAAEDHKPGCSLSGVEPWISSCACFLPLAAEGADPVLVDRVWNALKQRVCADPEKAKRCVMVGRDDIAAALSAITDPTLAREEGDEYRLMLLDLLAVIHRDGGHKTQEIGVKLAHEQAMRLSSERIYAREEGYRKGIEDAAKVAEEHKSERYDDCDITCAQIGMAIRALASKEQG